MKRRQLLQVFTATGATLLVPAWLSGCGDDDKASSSGPSEPTCPAAPGPSDDAFDGWQGPPDTDDVRLLVLSYALLAPNAHNIQSWKVVLTAADALELYVDPSRVLVASDPPYRQVHISVGAFLEILDMAAKHLGHRAEIALFPRGEYGPEVLEDAPVAAVRLVPDATVEPDPLFDHVLARRSNKQPYDAQPVAEADLDALEAALGPGPGAFVWTSEPVKVAAIADLTIEGVDIDNAAFDRMKETVDVMRFTDEELIAYRNGFDMRSLGAMGLTRELVLSVPETYRQQAVAQHEPLARGTPTYGWLTTATNTRRDHILVGRQYVRMNLAATGLGVSMHPNSQTLQEYADMDALRLKMSETLGVPRGHKLQMLVRLGYGPEAAKTARKRWADFSSCA